MTDLLWRSDDGSAEVWLADALSPEDVATVLGGRRAGALIVDAPYSERTHTGHDNGAITEDRAKSFGASNAPLTDREAKAIRRYSRGKRALKPAAKITYAPWDATAVETFVGLWAPLTTGWLCSLTDHTLYPHWESSCSVNNRVTFAPLPFVETGSRVRMTGDGPSSWTCWISVSRPRGEPYSKWGALRGAYVLAGERTFNSNTGSDRIIGGKPVRGMVMLVEDYSNRGDLIIDPCCGAGTTGVAARMMGRRFIGIDTCREHCEIAIRRLKDTREQVALPGIERAEVQLPMLLEAPEATVIPEEITHAE